jgi:endonuclease/exonuclease/phosphatase family metal-dependent hydrolase
VTYNILNYPDNYVSRNPEFQKVLQDIDPDIVIVQEITSQFGVDVFLSGALGAKYKAGLFIDGPDTDNAIFYKDSLFTFISNTPISSPQLTRDISEFKMVHNFTLDTLLIFSVHLKASEEDSTVRKNEVTVLRNVTDNLPPGTNFIITGDFNIYRASESAYVKLISKTTPGYVIDPLPAGNWHNNDAYAILHTQSTCNLSSCPNGGSNGGLDDRFDMILISQSIFDSSSIYMLKNSNKAYGNDGLHFNKSINVPPYTVITQEVANALFNSSDHLPVVAEFEFGDVNSVQEINPYLLTYNLYQNYPNPFNPSTTIKFEVPEATHVNLELYDLLGRRVKVLFDGQVKAGTTEVLAKAEELASGVYFYHLITPEFYSVKKLVLLK